MPSSGAHSDGPEEPDMIKPAPRATDPETIRAEILEKLAYSIGKDPAVAKRHDWLNATVLALRDRIIDRWMESTKRRLPGQGEAGLLPVARIPHRPAAARCAEQSRTHRRLHQGAAGPQRRHRPRRGAGARRGARQWRPRAACRLLHGEHGEPRHSRLWLWHPLQSRPVPPEDQGRLAGGTAGELAGARQPVGIRAARGGL